MNAIDFEAGDVVSYAGDEYLVLMNYGDSGEVAAMNDGMTIVKSFRWHFDGEDAVFVRRATPGLMGLLPGGLWRYVCFADGTVLLNDACRYGLCHKDLTNLKPDVKAVSAGKIRVKGHGWVVNEGGSQTTGLYRGGE